MILRLCKGRVWMAIATAALLIMLEAGWETAGCNEPSTVASNEIQTSRPN